MKFHNPYNFVRTPARNGKILESDFLGDYDPSKSEREENFSRYWPERFTGDIPVKLRTVTPLFITAPNSKTPGRVEGHYIYDCVKEIPAAALKGMLSSAYEIITNSRYRIFSERQHSKRLGFRYNANASLVPGRISFVDGIFSVILFTGTSKIGKNKPDGPLYAAWLSAYRGGSKLIPDDISNGQYYEGVELGLYNYGGKFDLWSVKRIGNRQFQPISKKIRSCEKTITVSGYVVISGKTINRKHDERFFFNEGEPIILPISDAVRKRYEDLIADYQRKHVEVNGKVSNPPNDPKDEGIIFGRHIEDPATLDLKDGDFVYVKTNGSSIESLYPVQISRELSDVSVWECLDESLKPADDISKLSPADRLFGWVNQNGSGSWKGKIRISAGKFSGEQNKNPVEHFETPLTLSILGEPQPSQSRFYLGNRDGSPQKNGLPKEEASYKKNKHIRGRKVYLHHTLHYLRKEEREQYWKPFTTDSLTREYKLSAEPSNQNRSITGWIPVKSDFYFSVHVENLTPEELGALLVLFSLGNDCCFRLGYGKPLGLGSVKLSIAGDITVATGEELAERYKNLLSTQKYKLSDFQQSRCLKAYQRAMVNAYGKGNFDEVEAPDVLNFDENLYALLDGEQKKKLHVLWQSAIEGDNENPPLEEIPEKEILFEFFPQDYFKKKYAEDLKTWRDYRKQYKKNDFGWGKLEFIEAFLASMKGFEEPVMYPISKQGSEGFQWFSQNERQNNGTCTGYSLPVIGGTLEEL